MPGIIEPRDKVRLLISDTGGSDGDSFVFSNTEIETFIEMETSLYGAAATALRTLAGNEALVSKRITFLEMKTDGPAVAKELRSLAKEYEDKASDTDSDVTIIEIIAEQYGERQARMRT